LEAARLFLQWGRFCLKVSLWWWLRGGGAVAGKQHQEFSEFHSGEFDKKLSELLNDDSIIIIEVMKGEAPQRAIKVQGVHA
jgi:hypothetical protein